MRVVIAEDLVLLRQSIARMLLADGIEVVAEVGDAGSLLSAVVAHRPDLVVTDVRMPPDFTDEGARAAMLLRERYPEIGVVVLSHVIEPQVALTLARGRATRFAYLLKDHVLDLEDFVAVLRQVHAGGTVVDERVVRFLLGAAGPQSLGALTARERDVLALIAQGLSNVAIARTLVISERTVNAHTRSLLAKLGLEQNEDEHRRVRATLLWLADRTAAAPEGGSGRIGAGADVPRLPRS